MDWKGVLTYIFVLLILGAILISAFQVMFGA